MSNDFLVWAPSGGNVMSQAAYAGSTFLANGVITGLADPTLYNKSVRQSSIMAAVIADLIVAETAANVVDNGTTATILANFISAIRLTLTAHANTWTTTQTFSGIIAPVGGVLTGNLPNPGMAAGAAVANIGFNPVQQGTGIGQTSNVVRIGYNGAGKTLITIDASNFGNIAMESWVDVLVHDVSGSRSLGTTYTNTTGKNMYLSVNLLLFGTRSPNPIDVNVTVDGTAAFYGITNVAFGGTANYGVTGTAVIPPGSTYKVGSLATPDGITWKETY